MPAQTITIPVSLFFDILIPGTRDWICMDKLDKDIITQACPNYEDFCHFEQGASDKIFICWRAKDWRISQARLNIVKSRRDLEEQQREKLTLIAKKLMKVLGLTDMSGATNMVNQMLKQGEPGKLTLENLTGLKIEL